MMWKAKKNSSVSRRPKRNDIGLQAHKRTAKRGTVDRTKTVRAKAGTAKRVKSKSGRTKSTRTESSPTGSSPAKTSGSKPIGSKATGVWILLMFIFIAELFFYTWCRVQSVKVGYELAQVADNQKSLREMRKNLKIEVVRLKSPERLAVLAKQLQLKTPTAKQTIFVR